MSYATAMNRSPRPVHPAGSSPTGLGHGPLAVLPKAGRTFLESLVQLQLLDATVLPGFLHQYRERLGDFQDHGVLGESLVQAGLLTAYQLNRVQAGTTHGLVLGPYRVLDRLGGGSVGVVFLGEHLLLRRRVAIKVVPTDEGFPPPVLERFYAEMRVLAGLHHPNIVLAYDAGRLAAPSASLPTLHYLVMELVTGGDLENHVYEHGPLPVPRACALVRQAAAGLQEAHDHHLVHRDLKPSNLLLTTDGVVKLVDFGLARQFYSNRTDPRTLLGSIEFMAPEQSLDPTAVNARADLYALGATLFWILTRETPYAAEASVAKALNVLQHQPPRRLRDLKPDAPAELDQLLARMMARDPAARPASPLDVMPVLARFTAGDAPAWEIDTTALATSTPGEDTNGPTGSEATWRVLLAGGRSDLRQEIKATLEAVGCQCDEVVNGKEVRAALRERACDLVLLDLGLDGPKAYDLCRALRDQPPGPHLKVLVHGTSASAHEVAESILQGADDFLPHPLDLTRLAVKAQHLLRLKDAQDRTAGFARQVLAINQQLHQSMAARQRDVRRAQDALLFALAKMAESREGETAGHLRRLQQYSGALARELRAAPLWRKHLDDASIEQIERCAPLHDIGKLALPDQLLAKPGAFTPDERRAMQTHTTMGSDLLDAIRRDYGEGLDFLTVARGIVRHHHERYDGTGYPDRLHGEAIPPPARIVALADVYDALRRRRPHKQPLAHEQAVHVLLSESAGAFDPTILRAFNACHERFQRIYLAVPS